MQRVYGFSFFYLIITYLYNSLIIVVWSFGLIKPQSPEDTEKADALKGDRKEYYKLLIHIVTILTTNRANYAKIRNKNFKKCVIDCYLIYYL